jgi:signal transduction histidine kinase
MRIRWWQGKIMRIRWWQSIRWQLAIGSVLVSLVATGLLTLAALFAIVRFYDIDQQSRLTNAATSTAQLVSDHYTQDDDHSLYQAAKAAYSFPRLAATTAVTKAQGDDYLLFVIDHDNDATFPTLKTLSHGKDSTKDLLDSLLDGLDNPDEKTKDGLGQLRDAVLQAQQGKSSTGEIGTPYLGVLPRAFAVEPVKVAGKTAPVGVIVLIPTSAANNTLPPFIKIVGRAVLLASVIVTVLAAIAGILFSRTITHPLAKLNSATRKMAAGDYGAQVRTKALGELGELATTFNDMAAQLQRDVEELRKQEIWRRELLMSITHDLATPLTAIAGLGEALADGVDQSHEDYEATGRIIVRETLRLRRLVQDLHMMAKVEAGALHPHRKPIRLATLLDEVLAVLTPEFEREQVEPVNAISYNLPIIQADPDMLARVFANLCDNALHFTPAGGTITVEAQQQDEYIVVAVTDTGPGIAPEALSRVFERFFRGDSARQSKTGGSGLGLAIVRAIVEAHGGRIGAENAPGAGARLLFTLPLQAAGQSSLSDTPTLPLEENLLIPPRR